MKTAILILTLASSLFGQFTSTNAKRIQGKNVGSLSLCADGDALTWVSANARFECVAGGGGGGGTASTQAQAETGTNNTAMITPLAATYSVASAGACGLVSESSDTTIRIFPGATTAHPCIAQFGNVTRRITSSSTVVLGSPSVSVNGSVAYFYVKPNGTIYAGLPAAFTQANITPSGATLETVSDFPAGVHKIGTWLAGTTDNKWDTTGGDGNGGSNYISLRTRTSALAGAGIVITESADGEETFTTDTATIPTISDVQTNSKTYALIASASGTTYTCNPSSAVASLSNGVGVWCKVDTTSTGAATLNVSSLGAKKWYKFNGTSAPAQITTNELRADVIYHAVYDSSLDSAAGGWLTSIGGGGASGKAVMYFPISIGGNNSGGSTYIGVNSAYTGCTGAASDISNAGGIGQVDLDFADAATNCAGFNLLIPNEWDAGTVTLSFSWWAHSGGSNGQVVVWNVETGCVGDNASAVSGPTYNTAQAVNSTATNATAGVEQKERITSLTMTGCAVNDRLWVKISRIGADGSDTFAGTAALSGLGLRMLADLQ